MAPDVEFLIVSYASADVIERCLASVAAVAPTARVAIREHAADAIDELERVADASPVTTRVEVDTSNPGFGAGCNALAAGSTAEWLVFLNPDTQLAAWPWRDDSPPHRTIVGPVFTSDAADHYGRSYRVRDEIARSWLRRPGAVPDGEGFVSGAALLVDARSFRELGGFDESYFLFYEDIDLCTRANRAGIATTIEPRWRVGHERAHSTRSRVAASLQWSYESACRFHESQGASLLGYRAYVIADSAARSTLHLARRDAARSRAYRALAVRACRDLVR